MGKCQWYAPPSPFPLTKGPELRSLLTSELIDINLRPHMLFRMTIVAIEKDGRKKFVVVLACVPGLENSIFMAVRYGLTLL